jgi:hypothetical protein
MAESDSFGLARLHESKETGFDLEDANVKVCGFVGPVSQIFFFFDKVVSFFLIVGCAGIRYCI